MMYIRKCKTCGNDVFHKNENLLLIGINRNGECKKCAASKNIPEGIWEKDGNSEMSKDKKKLKNFFIVSS